MRELSWGELLIRLTHSLQLHGHRVDGVPEFFLIQHDGAIIQLHHVPAEEREIVLPMTANGEILENVFAGLFIDGAVSRMACIIHMQHENGDELRLTCLSRRQSCNQKF